MNPSESVRRAAIVLATGSLLAAVSSQAAPLQRSEACGACHGPIRTQWAASGHGSSWTNPVFQAFLADAKAKHGDIQGKCIPCHAPLAHVTGDAKVEAPVAKEGVTCQFCHGVSSVEPSTKAGSYAFDQANPKLMRGPYRDADAPGAHPSAYSEIHTKSEFCAACHSYTHPVSGVLIEGTYRSWKRFGGEESGMSCQQCHMPPSQGRPSTLGGKTRPAVNAHTFVGPRRSPAILEGAATLQGRVDGGRLRLEVTNDEAGHSLPGGGNSFRTITLDVVFRNAAGAAVQTVPVERFGVEFRDGSGTSPVPKWNAAAVARDTEIGPDSMRVATCDIPAGAVRAEAVLTYHSIHPAYRAMLEKRGVDLSSRAPVVLARTTVTLR